MLLALLQGSVRIGTTGEAEQEGGHNQLTPVQPFALPPQVIFFQDTSKPTLASPGLSSAQDSLLPDPYTRALKIPEHWCCEAPSPSRHSAPRQGGASTPGTLQEGFEDPAAPTWDGFTQR